MLVRVASLDRVVVRKGKTHSPSAAIFLRCQSVRNRHAALGADFDSERRHEFEVSKKNKDKKGDYDNFMLESMILKKVPVSLMNNIYEFVGKLDG